MPKDGEEIEETEVESPIQSDVMIEEETIIEEDNQVRIHDKQGIDKTQLLWSIWL